MTDNELKELVASIAIAQKETNRQFQETDKQLKEINQEINKEIKALTESMAISRKETDRQLKESVTSSNKRQKEIDRQIKELGKQIGGLGRKFGSFTEGLALPSMQKILQTQFKMEVISPSVRVKKGKEEIEIDVLAYANSVVNEVYIVEVKSHLREEGIIQLQKMMQKFRYFFPEHHDKKLYGILAAVDMSLELQQRLLSLGFYTASIKEDIFSLNVPDNFQAKVY